MISPGKTIESIGSLDPASMEAARSRQETLTKPGGSLGTLEEISVKLAGIRGMPRPKAETACVFVMAGDHGVTAEGVSAYPGEVTFQMVMNFLSGGAAVNVLSRQAGARVAIADVGVKADFPPMEGLYRKKVARGTRNMLREPAMTRAEAESALEAGIDVFESEYLASPFDVACTGDMGIGNTTSSSAIVCAMTGIAPLDAVGRGTGIDDAALGRKVDVVTRSLAARSPDPKDAIDILAKVGGLEIAAIAGVILASAARRVPVIVDGFISTAAALVAFGLEPKCRDFMFAGHKSVENGQAAALDAMGLKPILDLGMRLGEGTGAVLALHVLRASARILDEMATFSDAGVSGK